MLESTKRTGPWDRQMVAVIVCSAIVLVTRAIVIAHFLGPTRDENYHLYRGLILLRHDSALIHDKFTKWNDPPFGDAIVAIPALLNGVHMLDPILARDSDRNVPPPPENQYIMTDSIRIETAIWLSILFLPTIAVVFTWVREIYSLNSAWLAVVLLLVEPTLAAHLPLPTLDVLGVSGIVISCWCAWRYINECTPSSRLLAAVSMAVALTLKNTALLLPLVVALMAVIHWIALPLYRREAIPVRRYAREVVFFCLIAGVTLWVCTFCDISTPDPRMHHFGNRMLAAIDRIPLPAGIYLRSVVTGVRHAHDGHSGILLGKESDLGWWYYFPIVATFKIPIGMWIVILAGAASLTWLRPRYSELPLFICATIWSVSLMRQHINIGYRHFLVPETFWLMLASRCSARRVSVLPYAVWLATAAAAVDVALVTPDYLSYINFPRHQWYLQISDSNVDWGQGTKEIRAWIDRQKGDRRPIYLGYFGPFEQDLFTEIGPRLTQYVMNEGKWLGRTPNEYHNPAQTLPQHGILIVSPILVTGQYKPGPEFTRLRNVAPKELIGHALLVYDLDVLNASGSE
jgi:hypothetical protein